MNSIRNIQVEGGVPIRVPSHQGAIDIDMRVTEHALEIEPYAFALIGCLQRKSLAVPSRIDRKGAMTGIGLETVLALHNVIVRQLNFTPRGLIAVRPEEQLRHRQTAQGNVAINATRPTDVFHAHNQHIGAADSPSRIHVHGKRRIPAFMGIEQLSVQVNLCVIINMPKCHRATGPFQFR